MRQYITEYIHCPFVIMFRVTLGKYSAVGMSRHQALNEVLQQEYIEYLYNQKSCDV